MSKMNEVMRRWRLVIPVLGCLVIVTIFRSQAKSPQPSGSSIPRTLFKAGCTTDKSRGANPEAFWRALQTASGSSVEPLIAPPESVIPALYATKEYLDLRKRHKAPSYVVAKPIPVIGIPVMNRGDWLKRLVYSIDVPVNRIHLVFNTVPGSPKGKEDEEDVQRAIDELQSRIGAQWILVTKPGCNLGCAGAWNTIIEKSPDAPYWLITNADVAFGAGALARVSLELDNPKLSELQGFFYSSFRFFVIRRSLVLKIGVFDENYWPAYSEDTDYRRRLVNSGLRFAWIGMNLPDNREFTELDHAHGNHEFQGASGKMWMKEDAPAESGSIRHHEEYRERLKYSSETVRTYASKKWHMRKNEQYSKYPFNNAARGQKTWVFDEKVRSWLEGIWDFDNSPDLAQFEDYFGWYVLPGDQAAPEESGWNKTAAFVPPGFTRENLPRRLCTTSFAKHNGETEWLFGA